MAKQKYPFGESLTSSAEATAVLGGQLAQSLKAGEVIAIKGDIGAGKTTFIRGVCKGLGIKAPVTSPTFTIGNRYPGPVAVAHLDLYRLGEVTAQDFDFLLDYLDTQTVTFIEWPHSSLEDFGVRIDYSVTIEHKTDSQRLITIGRNT